MSVSFARGGHASCSRTRHAHGEAIRLAGRSGADVYASKTTGAALVGRVVATSDDDGSIRLTIGPAKGSVIRSDELTAADGSAPPPLGTGVDPPTPAARRGALNGGIRAGRLLPNCADPAPSTAWESTASPS
jgi:hypothetical protein